MMKKIIPVLIFCSFLLNRLFSAVEIRKETSDFMDRFLQFSGYTQVNYAYLDAGINGFRIKRARIKLTGEVLKNLFYKLQIDTVNNPILLDAQVEFKFSPYANLKFGQFKIPFSLENLVSSFGLDTINRSRIVEELCPGRDMGEKGRDIGFEIYGQLPKIEYSLGVFNGSGINKTDYNQQKDIALRLVFKPLNSVHIALSNYNGRYISNHRSNHVNRNRTGVEMFFVGDYFSLKGEYILGKDEQARKCGWYIQASYYFLPEKFQAVVKCDSIDVDRDINGNHSEVITLGLNYFFSKASKFQINYEFSPRRAW